MVTRSTYLTKIAASFKHVPIVVLIGARQVGKTSLMKDFKEGKPYIALNGQDPEVAALFQRLLLAERYLQNYLTPELEGYLMLDEFQYVDGIATMLKLLTDKYPKLKVLCTGSSSLDILQKVEESLAGRVRVVEVFSLSFAEYLLFKDEKLFSLYQSLDIDTESSALTAPLDLMLAEYLCYGGLPRAALAQSNEEKIEILNDIYQTYLLKDVRNYIVNEHIVGFNKLLRLLAAQVGNLVNVNELSRESGLSYKGCEAYLSLLEQMYIIKMVEPYASNKRKSIAKMKKVYFCDLGLRNMVSRNFNDMDVRPDNGALFENYVMLELLRNNGAGGTLQFFRTSDGVEVDFIVERIAKKMAVECKFKQLNKPVSLHALNSFCNEENIENRFIVNRSLNAQHNKAHLLQGFLVGKI